MSSASNNQEHYVMEGVEGELQRLADQHAVLKHAMGALTVAPVDFSRPNLRILDSGTADGLWLRELQESLGDRDGTHEYIGTDIASAFFPKQVAPAFVFCNQSITQDWPQAWEHSFDYVHQRLTLAGAAQTPVIDCVTRLVQLVKPGGWIELVEADFTGPSTNGPAMKQFETMMRQFLTAVGVGFEYARPLKAYLQGAELRNVHERIFNISYGAACKDAQIATKSVSHLVTASKGLWEFTHAQASVTPNRGELEDFQNAILKELEAQGAHFKMVAVWGQTSL